MAAFVEIDPEKAEKVLVHMIETHGLRFEAQVMGHHVPEFKLKENPFLGLGKDLRQQVTFGAIVSGSQYQFVIGRAKMTWFKQWVDEAFDNLLTEACEKYATLPSNITVEVFRADCVGLMKSYRKETQATASV